MRDQRDEEIVLAGRADSLPVARDWAEARLHRLHFNGRLDDALLVVSELVTNAVRHAAGEVRLRMRSTDGGVRIAVHDHGRGRPVVRERDEAATQPAVGGWGLRIVEAFSTDWGVEEDGTGKTVWAVVGR